MSESFDREKIIDCMFDPITSEILAELEDGQKQCSFLAQKNSIATSTELNSFTQLSTFQPSFIIISLFLFNNYRDCKRN